ncbi:MAG: recombination mediator RecR [Chloroflexota bacterium]
MPTAEPVARLIEELNKLPGIGPKSAQRLAYHLLLRVPQEEAAALAEAILQVKEKIHFCSICFNITDTDPCAICRNEQRSHSQICVVEQPSDILSLERTRKYQGVYHVLHGVISPAEGIGPDDLKLNEFVRRVQDSKVEEVVMAINPNLEGETTIMYLCELLAPRGIRITRLARGLPFGAELEYADDVTLSRAFEERQQIGK